MEKNIDFEEMKQQLHLLQQRIDNQVKINEKQTRRAIDDSLGSLRKKDERSFRLCLLLAFLLPVALYSQGLPRGFIVASFCLLLVDAAWRKYLNAAHDKLLRISLVETSKNLLKYKRNQRNAVLIGIPLRVLWYVWYILNLSNLPQLSHIDFRYFVLGMSIGGVAGLIIGLTKFYLPQQRAADRLLRQIEEGQSEK